MEPKLRAPHLREPLQVLAGALTISNLFKSPVPQYCISFIPLQSWIQPFDTGIYCLGSTLTPCLTLGLVHKSMSVLIQQEVPWWVGLWFYSPVSATVCAKALGAQVKHLVHICSQSEASHLWWKEKARKGSQRTDEGPGRVTDRK